MLEGTDYDKVADAFEVSAHAVDKLGRNVMVYLTMDPPGQSGPLNRWSIGRMGHQFSSYQEAVSNAASAGFTTFDINSVDKKSIQVLQYIIKMKKETSFVRIVEKD
jgi:uncharacterized protein YdbL (DUF1318 family)